MAIIIVANPGYPNANSFQTVSEIDAYFQGRVPATFRDEWLDADPVDKVAAAITSTIWMKSLIVWSGYPADYNQGLPFPRTDLLYWDGQVSVPSNIIPQEIKNAHAELSRLALLADRTEESDSVKQGLTMLKAGPATLMFQPGTSQPSIIPQYVIDLMPSSWIDYVKGSPTTERELLRS